MWGITQGSDGALWIADQLGQIARFDLSNLTLSSLGNPSPYPYLITPGPDGALWFAENSSGNIGRITTAGSYSTFSVNGAQNPYGITTGSDGAIWFTDKGANAIGRLTPDSTHTYAIPTPNSLPQSITAGPDGALWFVEAIANAGKIGRITTDGSFTEFPLPSGGNRVPTDITVGPDGALWFTELTAGMIGRISTSGNITEFQTPSSFPYGITNGPDRNLWFTGYSAGTVGQFVPPAATSPLYAATLPSSRSVQVGGDVATAFASIINTGPSAVNCGIAPVTTMPANFLFQTTDPHTNQLTGTPNARVPIAAGATQSFLVAFTPNNSIYPVDVVLGYACDNVDAVVPIIGVNSLLLTFSTTPVPDMIAVGLTPSNDGYSHTGGVGGTGVFAIAADNIGASGQLTAQALPSNVGMSLSTTVCQTDPNTGQCLAPPSSSVTITISQNQNTTWTAFLTASGLIPQDPANNRVFFEFVDSSGVVRGSTSTAVTTQ